MQMVTNLLLTQYRKSFHDFCTYKSIIRTLNLFCKGLMCKSFVFHVLAKIIIIIISFYQILTHNLYRHSFGEQFSQKKWTREVAGQREILAAYGGVHLEDVRGMRAPFLSVSSFFIEALNLVVFSALFRKEYC